MVRNIVLVCAAVAGFGMTLERPNNLAEARRRCCYQRYQHYDNCCQTGYQSYASQNQYVNQCGQTYYPGTAYNQGTHYQSYSQGGEANVPPPAPAPAPDNRSTYYRNGTTAPPPAPANRQTTPAPAEQRTFDNSTATPRSNNAGANSPATEGPATTTPKVPE